MKKLVMIALASAASLAAANFSGIWNGKGGFEDPKYGLVPQTAQLTLLQAGSSLTGTLKLGNGKPIPITSGTVSAGSITFAVGSGGTGKLTEQGGKLAGKLTSSTGKVYDVVFAQK